MGTKKYILMIVLAAANGLLAHAQDRVTTRNGTLLQGAVAFFSPTLDSLVIRDAAGAVKHLSTDTLTQVWIGDELVLGHPVHRNYWILLGAGFQLGIGNASGDPQIRTELAGGYRFGKFYTGPGATLSAVNNDLLISPGWQIRYRFLNRQASPFVALHGALSRNVNKPSDSTSDYLNRGNEWGLEVGFMKHKRDGGGYLLAVGYREYNLQGSGSRFINFDTTVPTTLRANWHRFYLQFAWLL